MITKFISFESLSRKFKYADPTGFRTRMIYIDDDDNIDLIYSKNPKLNTIKFKLGDYVYDYGFEKDIFQIIGIDLSASDREIGNDYVYRLQDIKTKQLKWGSTFRLTLVPDYEIDAIKYNI
jgi:hypothetical protein